MGKTISLKKAIDSGIIVLSKFQIKKCKKNDIKKVWYSVRADDPAPQLIDDCGATVFFYKDGKLRLNN
jgi:Leu/Phe-tRNA-protein transferase